MTDVQQAEASAPVGQGTLYKVPIAKAGDFIEVWSGPLPDPVYQAALAIGLKDLMNRGMTKIKSFKNLSEAEKPGAKAAAMEVAQKNYANLLAGKLPRMAGVKSSDDKIPGVVMTEARRLAKNLIKDEIKAAGGKISHYEAKDITAAANAFLETDEGKGLIEQAKANVEARTKAVEAKPAADITALQAKLGLSVSDKKVKQAEEKKAKTKAAGDAVLSAAKAGQVRVRTGQPNRPGAPNS